MFLIFCGFFGYVPFYNFPTVVQTMFISTASAQTVNTQATSSQITKAIDLVVSPPIEYILIKPGKNYQHLITIEQKGQTALEITPQLVSFESDGLTNKPVLKSDSDFKNFEFNLPTPEIQTTLQTPQGQSSVQPTKGFVLQPGEKKTVGITFTTLPSSLEKEYPLTVLFYAKQRTEAGTLGTVDGSQTKVQGAVGTNIILAVSNSDKNRGRLGFQNIQPPSLVDSLSTLSFSIVAKNTGVHALQATGSATITNWQGKKVAQFNFFPDMILANSTRLLRTSNSDIKNLATDSDTTDLDPTKIDPADLTTDFGYKPFFLIGPYTITTTMFANNDTATSATNTPDSFQANTVQEQLSVTVIALPYSIVAVGILLSFGWIGYFIFRVYYQQEPQNLQDS